MLARSHGRFGNSTSLEKRRKKNNRARFGRGGDGRKGRADDSRRSLGDTKSHLDVVTHLTKASAGRDKKHNSTKKCLCASATSWVTPSRSSARVCGLITKDMHMWHANCHSTLAYFLPDISGLKRRKEKKKKKKKQIITLIIIIIIIIKYLS